MTLSIINPDLSLVRDDLNLTDEHRSILSAMLTSEDDDPGLWTTTTTGTNIDMLRGWVDLGYMTEVPNPKELLEGLPAQFLDTVAMFKITDAGRSYFRAKHD